MGRQEVQITPEDLRQMLGYEMAAYTQEAEALREHAKYLKRNLIMQALTRGLMGGVLGAVPSLFIAREFLRTPRARLLATLGGGLLGMLAGAGETLVSGYPWWRQARMLSQAAAESEARARRLRRFMEKLGQWQRAEGFSIPGMGEVVMPATTALAASAFQRRMADAQRFLESLVRRMQRLIPGFGMEKMANYDPLLRIFLPYSMRRFSPLSVDSALIPLPRMSDIGTTYLYEGL